MNLEAVAVSGNPMAHNFVAVQMSLRSKQCGDGIDAWLDYADIDLFDVGRNWNALVIKYCLD